MPISSDNYGTMHKTKLPAISRFCIFGALFFIMFIAVSFFNGVLYTADMSERTRILAVSAAQGILVFVTPSLLMAILESRKPFETLSLNKLPQWQNVAGIIVCYITGMSFLNQLVYWNDSITFPSGLSEIEEVLRRWEDNSRNFTNVILSATSVEGLVSGVLIVGLLTGLAEELFFRGSIQRMLCGIMPRHVAVWVAAFIFSAMHFQFFGFIPRLMLGAFFGYLYIWSGTIWTAVIAHALNNSMIVIMSWLSANGVSYMDLEQFGVSEHGFPWLALASALVTLAFLYFCHKWFRPSSKSKSEIIKNI